MWLRCSLCSKNCFLPYPRLFSSNSRQLELPITRAFFRFPLKVRVIGSRLYVQLFILPISRVVGNKVQCLRKKRPVTPSESDNYGIILKIKEILTQEYEYTAKNISVIPRGVLAASPLAARPCSHSTVSKRKIRDYSQSKPEWRFFGDLDLDKTI